MSSNANLPAVASNYYEGLSKREFFALVFGAANIIGTGSSKTTSPATCIERGVQLADHLLICLEKD